MCIGFLHPLNKIGRSSLSSSPFYRWEELSCLSKVRQRWELECKVSVSICTLYCCAAPFSFLQGVILDLCCDSSGLIFPQSFCRDDDLQHLSGCHLYFGRGYFYVFVLWLPRLKIPWESGVSRSPSISHLMFLVNALPTIEIQLCLMRSWRRPVHFASSHGCHLRQRTKNSLSFVRGGTGQGWWTALQKSTLAWKNNSKLCQGCFSGTFIHCFTYSFTHLFNPPFAHSFTYWCILPTAERLPLARCCTGH